MSIIRKHAGLTEALQACGMRGAGYLMMRGGETRVRGGEKRAPDSFLIGFVIASDCV